MISDLSTFKRKWRHVESKDAAKRNLKDFQFSVLCYNVLAQGLLDGNSYLYKQVHPQFLDWNFRKANLLQEMRCLNSDVSTAYLLGIAQTGSSALIMILYESTVYKITLQLMNVCKRTCKHCRPTFSMIIWSANVTNFRLGDQNQL